MKNLGEQFVWWYGVVEDRADPLEIGRVRVRCYGWHTDNLDDLPTKDLPWAQPIQDITSAAISGIGKSATGIVEGTWVVGFFADGNEAQRPIVMGTMAGIPTEKPDSPKGFTDPTATYPTKDSFLQADTPTLAKANAEEDDTLIAKRNAKNALGPIPTATAPDISTLKPDKPYSADYATDDEGNDTVPTWSEPNPRYGGEIKDVFPAGVGASGYPYNHVYNSESGHVFEVDDSPNAERLHKYHKAGTFEEIQPDGTRVTKVVGKNYEVVVDDENIYIRGTQNITVVGNAKLYVQGDHYTEVDGNQYVTVRGDRVTKIQGNDLKEVMSDESSQINGNKTMRVSGDRRTTVDGFYDETIGKSNIVKIKKSEEKTVFVNSSTMVSGNTSFTAVKNTDIGSGGNISIASGGTFTLKSIGAATMSFASTFIKQVTGVANLTYIGNYFSKYTAESQFDHNGDYWERKGKDYHLRTAAGVDYACSGDPARSSSNDCTDLTPPTPPGV
jgi:hypothetical protein